MHILIRLYDLLLPRIHDNTWEAGMPHVFPTPAPHISILEVGGERRQLNTLVRNNTHWAIRECRSRNFGLFVKIRKTSGLTTDQGTCD
jgi:hypothetical protein